MKLNFAVFKKGKTLYWIIGAVVIFVVFYLISSKGAGASSGGATMNSYSAGPSDTQVAAGLQMAQIQAQVNAQAGSDATQLAAARDSNATQIALATLAYQANLSDNDSATDITKYQTQADMNTNLAYIDAQKSIAELNSEYSLESARVATEGAIKQYQIQAEMFGKQLDTNVQALQIQSAQLTTSALIGQVGSLKKKDRDETLQIIAGASLGSPVAYTNPSGPALITGPISSVH